MSIMTWQNVQIAETKNSPVLHAASVTKKNVITNFLFIINS